MVDVVVDEKALKILRFLKEHGATTYEIVRNVGMGWEPAMARIRNFIVYGIVNVRDLPREGAKLYTLTEKGLKVLRLAEELRHLIRSSG